MMRGGSMAPWKSRSRWGFLLLLLGCLAVILLLAYSPNMVLSKPANEARSVGLKMLWKQDEGFEGTLITELRRAQFASWMARHNRTYKGPEEQAARFEIFSVNVQKLEDYNYPDIFRMSLLDMSDDEYNARHRCYNPEGELSG